MLLKVVALFLVFMVVMASLQKLLGRNRGPKGIDRLRCPRCKRIKVSRGPCSCGDTGEK
jgi:hypothetical protein